MKQEYIRATEDDRARTIAEWHEKYETMEREYLAKIDSCLASGMEADKQAICLLMENTEILNAFKTRNEMSYVINAVNIYYRECEADVKHTIFDMADSVAGLIQCMNQIRFLIWELVFVGEEESGVLLCEFLEKQEVSVEMLLYMVDIASIERYKTAITLADVFEREHKYKYLMYMLLYAVEQHAGDEKALCMLAELYMKAGKRELAEQCIKEVAEEGTLTRSMRLRYGF